MNLSKLITLHGINSVLADTKNRYKSVERLGKVDLQPASVACVIPCYNCADTLLRAVQSVLVQSEPVHEIILVDDCSTDETPKLIERLTLEDSRIVALRMTTNGGPSRARNVGWNHAKSKFIAFLDSDDSWHDQKVELQLQLYRAVPDLAITGHVALVDGEVKGPKRYTLSDAELHAHTRSISRRSLLVRNPWSTPTVMLRRDLPFRFDEDQREAEDFLLWAQILMSDRVGLRLELPLALLYKPRYGAGGLSGNLWKMEKGELLSFRKLWNSRHITSAEYCFAYLLSLAKYMKRRIRSKHQ